GRYTATGRVQATIYRRRRFPQRYTRADIELLAGVDEAHESLSGPATRRILEREVQLYGNQQYARLAAISVAHLYNLRKTQRYRERLLNYTKTRQPAPARVPTASTRTSTSTSPAVCTTRTSSCSTTPFAQSASRSSASTCCTSPTPIHPERATPPPARPTPAPTTAVPASTSATNSCLAAISRLPSESPSAPCWSQT